MKSLLAVLVGTAFSLNVLACSPSFLSEETVIAAVQSEFGNVESIKILKFRDTKYWGGEVEMGCPRFKIGGRAVVSFIIPGQYKCEVVAKENDYSNTAFVVEFKKRKCKSL